MLPLSPITMTAMSNLETIEQQTAEMLSVPVDQVRTVIEQVIKSEKLRWTQQDTTWELFPEDAESVEIVCYSRAHRRSRRAVLIIRRSIVKVMGTPTTFVR